MITKSHGKHGDAAIEAKGIVKRYKSGRGMIEVLKSVDIDAKHGDLTMIMGPSGSGKSTLIAALSGLLRPDEGTVAALDKPSLWKLSGGQIDKFRLEHCGFIFQGFNLFPSLTALQQVTTVLKYQGLSPDAAKARAKLALEEVGLGHRLNLRPAALSGGEKQRVAIARALAHDPAIIFADEPTGNLDSRNGAQILDLLFELADQGGKTLVVVTHDPAIAARGDRVLTIKDGVVA